MYNVPRFFNTTLTVMNNVTYMVNPDLTPTVHQLIQGDLQVHDCTKCHVRDHQINRL